MRRDDAFAVWVTRLVLPASRTRSTSKVGSGMAEHLNREERAADRPDDGVNGVPGRIHPRDFVREKFEEIENARDRDDPGMAEDFERLIVRREDDPVQVYRQAGDEDGEVKIDPGETGQAERHAQKVESFHAEISVRALCGEIVSRSGD